MKAKLQTLLLAGACAISAPALAQESTDTLQEALLQTYRSNPTLLAARANQRVTDENVPIQRAGALPSASVTPSLSQTVYDSDDSEGPTRTASAQLSLTLPDLA
jgi:outer membrane protein